MRILSEVSCAKFNFENNLSFVVELSITIEDLKCIRGNTRELNEVPSTNVSILYILDYWSMLY